MKDRKQEQSSFISNDLQFIASLGPSSLSILQEVSWILFLREGDLPDP